MLAAKKCFRRVYAVKYFFNMVRSLVRVVNALTRVRRALTSETSADPLTWLTGTARRKKRYLTRVRFGASPQISQPCVRRAALQRPYLFNATFKATTWIVKKQVFHACKLTIKYKKTTKMRSRRSKHGRTFGISPVHGAEVVASSMWCVSPIAWVRACTAGRRTGSWLLC
jgi:hypothetical protein